MGHLDWMDHQEHLDLKGPQDTKVHLVLWDYQVKGECRDLKEQREVEETQDFLVQKEKLAKWGKEDRKE